MTSVLLIDDDESNRLTLSGVLELEGFEVETRVSAADARARCELAPQPDLVLLDLHLGDGIGSDLLPLLRANFPAAKILLMSGLARGADPVPAPVDASFTKGESIGELLAKIEELLRPVR